MSGGKAVDFVCTQDVFLFMILTVPCSIILQKCGSYSAPKFLLCIKNTDSLDQVIVFVLSRLNRTDEQIIIDLVY
jgi:hypothetical protein